MKWIITQDNLDSLSSSVVGYGNYGNASDAITHMSKSVPNPESRLNIINKEILNPTDFPFEFRLLDDDDIVYFVGRCGDLDEADGDEAFAPLDWAQDKFGTTSMEYRTVGSNAWMIL